eukprot:PITA_25212
MGPASDRISKLEDELLCLILSKVPIKDAVKCSLLSKRWRDLYKQIPQLTLALSDFNLGSVVPDSLTVDNIIFNTLLFHGVEHLTLRLRLPTLLPRTLFSCTRLTTLQLSDCTVSHIPPNFAGFNNLTTCEFVNVEFRNDSLTRFISHCPVLEKLSIFNYLGLPNITISAPNITYLLLRVCGSVDLLNVRCPKVRSLTLSPEKPIKDLQVNGFFFHELSCAVQRLKRNCESNAIEELWLNWSEGEACNFCAEEFLEIVGTFKLLRELDIYVSPLLERGKEMKIPLLKLFQRLPHLERLHMRGMFVLELACVHIPASANTHFLNLRMLSIDIGNFGEKEMAVLGCLLENAPALQTLKVQLLGIEGREEDKRLQFLAKLSYWRRASSQARVCVAFE